jgi:dTDP-4-dehydrorhamnose 3,5-epimerase
MITIDIPGVIVARPEFHRDVRGSFVEIFRAARYPTPFVQANHSRSKVGVLRGLHYHRHQADLWYVVSGRAQVALADLRTRQSDPQTATFVLDGDAPASLYIPHGIAHGFLALTEVELIYWVTREYDATDEQGIAWNDPSLRIRWANDSPILTARDETNEPLRWETIPTFT